MVASRYAPGARQPLHRDQLSRVSLVLRGGFREDGPSGSIALGAGGVLLKSQTVRHEDTFGPDGALLLTVEFDGSGERLAQVDTECWRKREDGMALRLGASLRESILAQDAISVDSACADLLAVASEHGTPRAIAPAWLTRLRDEVETSSLARIDVAARAREAGVHPAHVSRLFRRCVGSSITEYAQAHSVRRAIELMSRPSATLSDVALSAGFYDQSHMNRIFRRVTGRVPGTYRRLMERTIIAVGS